MVEREIAGASNQGNLPGAEGSRAGMISKIGLAQQPQGARVRELEKELQEVRATYAVLLDRAMKAEQERNELREKLSLTQKALTVFIDKLGDSY